MSGTPSSTPASFGSSTSKKLARAKPPPIIDADTASSPSRRLSIGTASASLSSELTPSSSGGSRRCTGLARSAGLGCRGAADGWYAARCAVRANV